MTIGGDMIPPAPRPKPFLDGVRVLDLTTVWSGPLAGRILAELGADVILVEQPEKRTVGTAAASAAASGYVSPGSYTRDIYSILFHRNKRSIVLNLRDAGGRELFRRLVAKSDVVIENYGGPRVMANFGLDYQQLREVNPAVIYVGMPAFGMTGPHANHSGYGLSLEQLCGYPAITGYEDSDSVQKSGINYTDPVASFHAAGAVLAALIHRRRTGRGQLIDMSQRESGINLIGDAILEWSMNRRTPPRIGNHHRSMAPHNVYRCTGGDDPWVFIACRDDAEWSKLCREMGRPELAVDARFLTLLDRKRHERDLDGIVGEWTADQEPKAVETRLQRAGVPAGAVQDVTQTVRDPYVIERGLYEWVHHPHDLELPLPAAPWLFTNHPRPPVRVTSMPGADQQAVLSEVLGLTADEIAALAEAGVVAGDDA